MLGLEERVLGWTKEQWALMRAQLAGPYAATREGAMRLRIDWLNANQEIDETIPYDKDWANVLFWNATKEQVQDPIYVPPKLARA